jgi:hypothetical protein
VRGTESKVSRVRQGAWLGDIVLLGLTIVAPSSPPNLKTSLVCRSPNPLRALSLLLNSCPPRAPMKRLLSPALIAALLLSGCGAPKFDATTEASAKASMEAMTAGLSSTEKEEFSRDVMSVVMMDGLQAAFRSMAKGVQAPNESSPKFGSAEMFRPIQGLTRAQIHAKAEEKRKEFGMKPPR